jgi:tetratricopeptide (TPR) repeat protein
MYGIMMYVIKLIAPVNLSPFYPFPAINKALSPEFFIAPFFFIAFASLFFYYRKKNREIAFGLIFFFVNLLLVLQILPVGGAVMAERYTYIPYIGLFYIIGWLINKFSSGNSTKSFSVIIFIALLFSVLTFKQAGVWHSGATLWDHAIKHHPSTKAYTNRAVLFRHEKKYDLAIEYYTKALQLNVIDYESYLNRANVYFDLNKPDLAFQDYKKALSYKPNYYQAMDNMSAMFAVQGQYDSAIKYSSKAIELKPDYWQSYSNRALTYMKVNRNEEAIKDWEKFLEFQPRDMDIYNLIGVCYQSLGKYTESLIPLTKAINAIPNAEFYLNRSYSYNALNNKEAAKQDALVAKQRGMILPLEYAQSLGIE